MIEEGVLFPHGTKEEILKVLNPQVEPEILEYLTCGFFDDEKRRLIAYAIMPVDTEYYRNKAYLFYNFKNGHSFSGTTETAKKSNKYITESTYTSKSLQECIEEGLYHHNLVSFICEYDFDEWNVMLSCEFTDEKDIEIIIKWLPMFDQKHTSFSIANFFNRDSIFKETVKYYEENINRPSSKFHTKLPTNMKSYIGHSCLVALIRNQKKIDVNGAYEDYTKQAYFLPLSIKLKSFYPKEYQKITTFWGTKCNLLYPNHKQFCMMICIATNKNQEHRLRYFIHENKDDRIYEWTYFPPVPYRSYGGYSEEILDGFKQISKCDSIDYLRELDCTLDDEEFWNNYVFKKENDDYLYLKEIEF